ncbi:hypothetical protein GQ53DRAFT_810163, partial [Thozetella sp. PMI_491]
MPKRSRGGCRECKRARIKCDEAHPFCGTCARRDRHCPGYSPRCDTTNAASVTRRLSPLPKDEGAGTPKSPGILELQYESREWLYEDGLNGRSPSDMSVVTAATMLYPSYLSDVICDKNDQAAINTYFQCHLRQLGLGEEFVFESNGNVMLLLQQHPATTGDVLSAIGYMHLSQTSPASVTPALSKKSRLLATLRATEVSGNEIEPILLLALGLCALELLDTQVTPEISSIPFLVACIAAWVTRSLQSSPTLGSVAKYFLRAFARQDMILALTQRRRNLLPTKSWFDQGCQSSVDRFLGLTMPFMPVLEELCALAEECRPQREGSEISIDSKPGLDNELDFRCAATAHARATELRNKIHEWQPFLPEDLEESRRSFLNVRKYLLQAYAFRSSALLYLHRLLYPAGVSPEADATALNLAYEVLTHCCGGSAEVRLLLWPIFIAGCEMSGGSDRELIVRLLDQIYRERGTSTALRTKEFLVHHIWHAMDSAERCWDWMVLVE